MASSILEPAPATSGGRQSMAPVSPSAADSLPGINFGFDDLRDRMAKFSAKFDAFIEQGRKNVLEERNRFRINVAELQGRASCLCRVRRSATSRAADKMKRQRTRG